MTAGKREERNFESVLVKIEMKVHTKHAMNSLKVILDFSDKCRHSIMSQKLQVGGIVVEVILEAIQIQNLGMNVVGPCLCYCSICKQNSFLFRYSCFISLLRSIISIF